MTAGKKSGRAATGEIRRRLIYSFVLASLPLSMLPEQASAQEQEASLLEEIIISARRYEESLQDAPTSVNTMDERFLQAQRIDTVNDVIVQSPGTTFIRFNKSQHEYSMRGINSQGEGPSGDSSVQTVIDNVVVSTNFMKNPEMFDISRVEVLRGPQGTSFGRNASAGLVHIITNRPTDTFEAALNGTAGSHELFEIDGFLSGPLGDTLSARLAFSFDTHDGYIESVSTGEGLNGEENFSVRGSLEFEPNENFLVYLKAEYNKDDDETPVRRSRDCTFPTIDGTGATAPVPPHPPWPITFTDPCDEFKTEISDGFDFFLEREIINLTGEIVIGLGDGISLTSVTGYLDGDLDYLIDAHGTPVNVLFQEVHAISEAFSQEVRIDNAASGNRFRWLAGVYYLNEDQERFDENQFFQGNALPFPRVPTKDTRLSANKTDSIGLFGELTYDLTDRLNATFGARWSRDEKDYEIAHFAFGFAPILEGIGDGTTECVFFPPGGQFTCGTEANPVGFTTPVEVSDSWDNVSFRGSLQYDLSDTSMVYALYSEGYKTGGFQPEPPNPQAALIPFDEETAKNYELGFKGEFAGRFRLNVAGYYIDYNDLQVSQFVTVGDRFFQLTSNAATVEVIGIEAEALWQITETFRIGGSFSVLDSEFKDTFFDTDSDGVPEDFTGARPDNIPNWTGTAYFDLDFPLAGGSFFTLHGDWRGQSDVFDDVLAREERLRVRPSVNIFGARLTWTSASGNFSASVWGRNLTEDEEVLNIGPPQPNTIQLPTAFGEPRTYGVTAGFRF